LSVTPFGTIAAGPDIRAFDLHSFYLACNTITENSLLGVAESCTIAVTGYYVDGMQAPEVTFAFADTEGESNVMVLAELPGTYVGLINVSGIDPKNSKCDEMLMNDAGNIWSGKRGPEHGNDGN
jgi:hypothetical protein